MNSLDALQAAPTDLHEAAMDLLDEVSAPLSERQLVTALRPRESVCCRLDA